MAVQMMWAQINVFKVTSTKDSGEGSLRAAVNSVNALTESSDSSRIVFDFSTNEEHVIKLNSFIYLNNSRVSIDASGCKGTVVIDGVDTTFAGFDLGLNLHNITIKSLTFRNLEYGVKVNVTRNACIENCVFESNQNGVDLAACISEVKNCTFIGNKIGVNVGDTDVQFYEEDPEIVNNSVNHIHDNFVGITSSDKENGNEIGICIGDKKPTYVYDNVICSNQNGIAFRDNGHDCYIRRNYIGVSKKFRAHGNKEAGINIGHKTGPIEIGSKEDKTDGNFIGYNKIGIINDKGSVNIYNNYIGVSPDFKSMSNKEAGVSAQNVYSDGNYIGFNGTNGIEFIYSSNIGADYIGGDGEHSFPNEGYGVYFSSESGVSYMKGTHIFNNKKGGFFLEHSNYIYPALPFEYSQCLFGGNQPFAVKRSIDYLTTPVIDKMYSDDQYVYIEGKVKLLDAENESTLNGFALDSIITVELFAGGGEPESALAYLGTTVTDENGNWSYKMERSRSVGKIIANATHQYHCTYSTSVSPRRYTSRFSEPYIGAEFLYDLTRLNYYVKTEREGKGDGSSWKDAMDGSDFLSVLPLASDGATFHVAEGEYDFSKLLVEKTISVVGKNLTILGGYSKNAAKGDVPNAIDYKTRFVANKEDKFSFEVSGGTSSPDEFFYDFTIRGVEFVDIQLVGSYLKNMKVDSCLFYSSSNSDNSYTNAKIVCSRIGTIEIGSCFFDMNYTAMSIYINACNNIIIKNSTFTEDFPSYQSIKAEQVGGDALIYNCTFTNIPCYDFITIYTEGKTYFYNNTVVGNAYAPNGTANIRNGSLDLRNCIMVGNIYAGNYMNSVLNQLLDSHDNLYSSNFNQITDKDKTIIDSDLYKILDGENKDGVFIPNLAYNGGFTPTIALKSDKLSDEKSIRFPRLDDVLTDQRGVSRMPMTCMGAYEIGCGSDTTFVVDSIRYGDKVCGWVFAQIGVHENFMENLKSADGCDSIVNHTVVVRPIVRNDYYVKEGGSGSGNGRNWANAMDSTDFAAYLSLAPEGATFHVAAGTYKPKYGPGLKKTNDPKELCYEINSKVTIIGGYPADAKENEVSEPDKYKTVFNGDVKHDNEVDYNGAYGAKYTYLNYNDNIVSMFSQNADLNLQGVDITGCFVSSTKTIGTILMNKENLKLNLYMVDFVGNTTCIQGSGYSEIVVDSCRFEKNVACGSNGGAITSAYDATLIVRNSFSINVIRVIMEEL